MPYAKWRSVSDLIKRQPGDIAIDPVSLAKSVEEVVHLAVEHLRNCVYAVPAVQKHGVSFDEIFDGRGSAPRHPTGN